VLAESLKDDITPDPLQWYQQAAANAAQGLPPWAGADAGGGGLLYGGEEGGLVGGSEGGLGEGQLLYDEDEDEDEEGGLDDDDDDADGGGGGGGVYADEGEMYVDEYEVRGRACVRGVKRPCVCCAADSNRTGRLGRRHTCARTRACMLPLSPARCLLRCADAAGRRRRRGG
jgi:hypothetical protein